MSELTKKLANIQSQLNAPKNQRNNFGNYNYRSCEDILQAVKPLLGDLVVLVSDEVTEVGGRIYVKAAASISDGTDTIECTGWAREAVSKKGMDDAQLTGSCSSYARKYALNGLLLIDDNKDADTQDNHEPIITAEVAAQKLRSATNMDQLKSAWQAIPSAVQSDVEGIKNEVKTKLENAA